MNYSRFIANKLSRFSAAGFEPESINTELFDFQSALTRWALRVGRCALFADTGLGKTRMQLAWADAVRAHTGGSVLILAPLAVADQTVEEGAAIGIEVHHIREAEPIEGICITNYERVHKFDCTELAGVVLDESSIIKHHDSRSFGTLTETFARTPYKLCATATPAPNDWTELGTHAEFLGVCSRPEMLAEFFVHDAAKTQDWRLKGHARALFWEWVASWAAVVRNPADIGFDGSRYELPWLNVTQHTIKTESVPLAGQLFAMEASPLSERRDARRSSMDLRVAECVRVMRTTELWGEQKSKQQNTTAPTTGAGTTPIQSSERGDARNGREPQKKTANTCAPTTSETNTAGSAQHANSATSTTPHEEGSTRATPSSENARRHSRASIGSSTRIARSRKTSKSSGLRRTTTNECSASKAEDARSAGGQNALIDCQESREGFTSTTATQPARSADCSVQDATSASGNSKTIHPGSAGQPTISRDEQWVIWCALNAEQDAIVEQLGSDCVSIYGSLDADEKVNRYRRWARGGVRYLVTKCSIFGWGVNMQFSRHAAFVGVTDSYESYYQAIRRQWRFGQTRPVNVHVFASDLEGSVVANLQRKEQAAAEMAAEMVSFTAAAVRRNIVGAQQSTNPYNDGTKMKLPGFVCAA